MMTGTPVGPVVAQAVERAAVPAAERAAVRTVALAVETVVAPAAAVMTGTAAGPVTGTAAGPAATVVETVPVATMAAPAMEAKVGATAMNPEGEAEEKAAPAMGAPTEAAATKRVSAPNRGFRPNRSGTNLPLASRFPFLWLGTPRPPGSGAMRRHPRETRRA